MSAPLKMTADNLEAVANFLSRITDASRDTDVHLCAYDRGTLTVDGNVLTFTWDAAEEEYVIDDRVGS